MTTLCDFYGFHPLTACRMLSYSCRMMSYRMIWVQEELWRSSNQLLTQSRDKSGHKIMFRQSPRKNTPQPLLACTSGFEDLCAGKFPFISQDFPFSSLLHHVLLLCTSESATIVTLSNYGWQYDLPLPNLLN